MSCGGDHQDGWLELVANVTNEKDMGTDSVRSIGRIKKVETHLCRESTDIR